jgi:hypothetical protein
MNPSVIDEVESIDALDAWTPRILRNAARSDVTDIDEVEIPDTTHDAWLVTIKKDALVAKEGEKGDVDQLLIDLRNFNTLPHKPVIINCRKLMDMPPAAMQKIGAFKDLCDRRNVSLVLVCSLSQTIVEQVKNLPSGRKPSLYLSLKNALTSVGPQKRSVA